ncbi:MAG: hypothetical protein ACOCT8_00575 [Actinomycetota bacterium]
MTEWRDQLHPLDHAGHGWRSADRVEQLLAGEQVLHVAAGTNKDVCDDGHVHTDVTLGLLTETRLLHVVAGDAQHVTDEHELALQFDVAVLPLSAITDVMVSCWGSGADAVTEVFVARAGAGWQAMGDHHDCGDPDCEIPQGSIRLEMRPDGMSFVATGADAEDLLSFATQVSLVAGR